MLRTVVLPAPFGPMMLVTCPLFIRAEKSVTARTPPNAIARWSISSACRGAPVDTSSCAETGAAGASGSCLRPNRVANALARPPGAKSSTASINTPDNSTRYSASPDSISGMPTTITAPMTGP